MSDQLATWLTKSEAAQAIGCSTKTIEKLAQEKKLQQGSRKSTTGAHVAVYHPQDVERIRGERNPEGTPFVVPKPAVAVVPAPELPASVEDFQRMRKFLDVATDFVERMSAMTEQQIALLPSPGAESSGKSAPSQNSESVPIHLRVYLSLPEAAAYSGLPEAYLRRQVREERIPGMKTGAGWRVRRTALEAL